MKYTALLLLLAVAFANAKSRGVHSNGCPRDWKVEQLLPHPNCQKFYQCWHGELIVHRCPTGLYFGIEENRCEWSEVVDCSGRDTVEEDQWIDNNQGGGAGNSDPSKAPSICASEGSNDVLVAHEKCNKFYICDNGKPVALRCPANLWFNPNTDRCDWPENVDCKRTPGGDNDGGNNENVGAGNSDPSLAPSICAEEDSVGVLVAHEKCNKFYICDNSKPVTMRCPANLLFNPNIDQCDWPKNVDCGDRIIPGSGGNDGENSSEENNNVGAGNSDPSLAPSICAQEGSVGVLVAHEKCNKFYICDNGKPVTLRCPANLFFNPYTDQCDWPKNVDCGDRIIPGGGDSGVETSTEGDNVDEASSEDNTGSETSTEGDNGGESSSEDNNGSETSTEGDNGGESSSEDNNGSESSTEGDNGDEASSEDNNGIETSTEGDNGGEASTEDTNGIETTTEVDNDDGNSNIGLSPEVCASADSECLLAAHENCNKFYTCLDGKPVGLNCPAGLNFNPNTRQCDLPENVDCGQRITSQL